MHSQREDGAGVTVEKELRSLALCHCLSKQEGLSMVVYFNVKTRGSDQSFLFSNSQEIKKVWFIQHCHVFYRVVLRELGYKKMSLTL